MVDMGRRLLRLPVAAWRWLRRLLREAADLFGRAGRILFSIFLLNFVAIFAVMLLGWIAGSEKWFSRLVVFLDYLYESLSGHLVLAIPAISILISAAFVGMSIYLTNSGSDVSRNNLSRMVTYIVVGVGAMFYIMVALFVEPIDNGLPKWFQGVPGTVLGTAMWMAILSLYGIICLARRLVPPEPNG